MTAEDAQDFALKFMRLARPDPLMCLRNWATPWKLTIENFCSDKTEYGFHLNYQIYFTVTVPTARSAFFRDDLLSIVYTRLDARWARVREYAMVTGGQHFQWLCLDAQIPNHDEYDHSFRRLP